MNTDQLKSMLLQRVTPTSEHPHDGGFGLGSRRSSNKGPAEEAPNSLRTAIHNFDSASLIKLLLHEVDHMAFKKKKDLTGFSDNYLVLEKLLHDMKEMLNYKFLNVDLQNSTKRSVNDSNWEAVSAIRRSEAGTTGIYFIQSEQTPALAKGGKSTATSVIVAKPIQAEEYTRHQLVNQMATDYFRIRCPRIRLLSKSDSEYTELENNVKRLFFNLEMHREMYQSGGKSSPKDLFTTNSILLMELVKGKPLSHRLNGQRDLAPADFRAVGRLFLLDLLVRNTDRLPCRKAMPRPGCSSIADQGNAGNLMFGDTPGSLWAIDPEMQTQMNAEKEHAYMDAFHSVVNEIVHSYHNSTQFRTLSKLFFERVESLEGILDASLDETTPWDSKSELQQHGIDAVLQLIRVRSAAFDSFIINNSTRTPPPEDSNEKAWREWIRMAVPRAIPDIVEFVEAHTGFVPPPSAIANVELGFMEAMAATKKLRTDLEDPFKLVGSFQKLVQMALNPEQGVAFIIRLVKSLDSYDHYLPELPQGTCDELFVAENLTTSSSVAVSSLLRRKKLLRDHVHKIGNAKLLEAKQQLSVSSKGPLADTNNGNIKPFTPSATPEPANEVPSVVPTQTSIVSPFSPDERSDTAVTSNYSSFSRSQSALAATVVSSDQSTRSILFAQATALSAAADSPATVRKIVIQRSIV
jgi:hypothetical protein